MTNRKFIRYFDVFCRVVIVSILIIYIISLLIPLVWMLFTSLKSYSEYYENLFLWPKRPIWENYSYALTSLNIKRITDSQEIVFDVFAMFETSLVYTVGLAFWGTFLTVLTAYAISRFKFKFCEFLYGLGIFVMVTPIIGGGVSAMVIKRALGIYDNMLLYILTFPSCTFQGFHFLLLYGAFKALPNSYAEAASIDGAGPWTIFIKIMFPMLLPTCTILFVLSFLSHWNDYGAFLVWLPSYANLAYGVYMFQNDATLYGANITQVMAGFSLVMVPSMVLYLAFNKVITQKYTIGGLKG